MWVNKQFTTRPLRAVRSTVQRSLAHMKHRPPRALQQDYAYDPTVFLGGGLFLMSEVPLYSGGAHRATHRSSPASGTDRDVPGLSSDECIGKTSARCGAVEPSSGSNVIPRRARPGPAGPGAQTSELRPGHGTTLTNTHGREIHKPSPAPCGPHPACLGIQPRVKSYNPDQSDFTQGCIPRPKCFICSPSYERACRGGHVGRNQNLKDPATLRERLPAAPSRPPEERWQPMVPYRGTSLIRNRPTH